MATSLRTLLKKLDLTPIDLSKLDETRGLYFENAILTKAKKADLSGCVFYRCLLVGVGFDQPNSVFIECTKRETMSALSIKDVCEFGKTSLLSLSGLNLSGANLQGAHLQGANLQGAELQDADLNGAFYDSNTDTGGLTEERKAVMIYISEDDSEDDPEDDPEDDSNY